MPRRGSQTLLWITFMARTIFSFHIFFYIVSVAINSNIFFYNFFFYYHFKHLDTSPHLSIVLA